MRFSQCVFILLLSGLISSCTLIKTVYNNAPGTVSWWLDGYFAFSSEQKSVLNPALYRLHDWHRQHQLPAYVSLLQDMQQTLAKPQISAAETCGKLDTIKSNIRALQLESIPIIVEMAPSLSNKQLQYFQKKLGKRTEKWQSEWAQETPAQRIEARLEKAEDFAEKVYGNLDASQRALLKQSIATSRIEPNIAYAELLRRNQDAFQILTALQNQSLSLADKSALVSAGFERLHTSPNAEYEQYADEITQRTCETIASLHASTSAKQKQHAKDWLENYIVELSALTP